jgi:hypothetical protein
MVNYNGLRRKWIWFTCFRVGQLCWQVPIETEENYRKPLLGEPVFMLRLNLGISSIKSRIFDHNNTCTAHDPNFGVLFGIVTSYQLLKLFSIS